MSLWKPFLKSLRVTFFSFTSLSNLHTILSWKQEDGKKEIYKNGVLAFKLSFTTHYLWTFNVKIPINIQVYLVCEKNWVNYRNSFMVK